MFIDGYQGQDPLNQIQKKKHRNQKDSKGKNISNFIHISSLSISPHQYSPDKKIQLKSLKCEILLAI